MDKRVMHIFYKDLNFHSALINAAGQQQVLPVFLWSEHLNQDVDTTPSLIYRRQWARVFNQQLLPNDVNMPLVETIEDIVAICQNFAIDQVTMLKHFEPREVGFQQKLALELKAHDIKIELYDIYRLNHKIAVTNANGELNFPDYFRAWQNQKIENEKLSEITWISVDLGNRYLKFPYNVEMQQDFNAYQEFLAGKLSEYTTQAINTLLNHGIINATDIYRKLQTLPNSEIKKSILYNLCYRDFAYGAVEKFPNLIDEDFESCKRNCSDSAYNFQLWCKGETGQHALDRAMKELYEQGRMSGEMRYQVAKYLIEELDVCWQEGVFWFKEHLVDYDLAINSCAWQWVANPALPFEPKFKDI